MRRAAAGSSDPFENMLADAFARRGGAQLKKGCGRRRFSRLLAGDCLGSPTWDHQDNPQPFLRPGSSHGSDCRGFAPVVSESSSMVGWGGAVLSLLGVLGLCSRAPRGLPLIRLVLICLTLILIFSVVP